MTNDCTETKDLMMNHYVTIFEDYLEMDGIHDKSSLPEKMKKYPKQAWEALGFWIHGYMGLQLVQLDGDGAYETLRRTIDMASIW